MSDLIPMLRAIIREELARHRSPELGIVTEVFAKSGSDSPNNHQVHVRLQGTGVELQRAAVAVARPGLSMLPRVGDLVVVAFLNGDLNTPVVLGSVYSNQSQPPEGDPLDVVYQPPDEGNADIRRFHLALPSGTQLTVQDDSVMLESGGTKVEILRDGDAIIESAGNLTLKAQGDVVIEAGGNIEIKATSNATLKGVATTVEGSGEAKVKAAAVTLAGNTRFSPS